MRLTPAWSSTICCLCVGAAQMAAQASPATRILVTNEVGNSISDVTSPLAP